jgi:Pectinacetylesterase
MKKCVITRSMFFAAAILLLGGLIACKPVQNVAEPEVDLDNQQEFLLTLQGLGFGKYLEEPQFHPQHTQKGDWDVYAYPVDELRCVLGGEYFIQTRSGSESANTVIWMDGGGSCWPGRDSCVKDAQIAPWIEESGLASSDKDNPVRDWNFVYVPYCNGSSYLGDRNADYDGDGEVDHWHWGIKSTSAGLRLMKEQFPDTEKVLIAGCSAGGAGTIFTAPVARLKFPEAKIYVLNISGPGLIKPEEVALRDLIKKTWGIEQFIPEDCLQCNEQILYTYSWLLEKDTELKVGIFSSYNDSAAISNWGMAPEVFKSLILSTTNEIHADNTDTFNRYFIAGNRHCMDDYLYEVNGISFWDWITYLVNEDPRWSDMLE